MISNNRKEPRFDDFAPVDVQGLCRLPGILENISLTGCSVRFPLPFQVRKNTEYTIQVRPARKTGLTPFTLIGTPVWTFQSAGTTKIGFQVLHSPGSKTLRQYVNLLSASEEIHDDILLEEACVL
ncbi:MAG: PilZ domain-containing protein [Spirochaetaceae bacterium]|nr:PilZ domain-containing protein [Spirochaetaceae bacterium]